MNLHENKQLFRQSIQYTAQEMKLPVIYVEKDYWVTYALQTIFSSGLGKETVFKGGTSLLKCYQLIERFSEDIDLVVFRNEGESDSRMAKKIKDIGHLISAVLPEVHVDGVTQKMGMNRKTAHTYNQEFSGAYGQVRDVVIVEATWLGYFEPYETRQSSSFIHDMMLRNNQESFIDQYQLYPFDVLCLQPKRTICEKIMSLVRFSYDENPILALQNKIRHLYDLYKLLQAKDLSDFFDSDEFDALFRKVGSDDVISYKNNNDWLKHHPKNAMIFADPKAVWGKLRAVYEGDFQGLIFDLNPPSSDQILDLLLRIQSKVSTISWDI